MKVNDTHKFGHDLTRKMFWPEQKRARIDRICTDPYHAAQDSIQDEKGKNATEGIALNGIEDDFCLTLIMLILKLIMLIKDSNKKK